ncbi:MAG: plasmid pRiA4b ORF-3 family protein [bacterium]
MRRKFESVYQFKITLLGVNPPVWRRIQVPETYDFWELHVAIQDAMGWYDYHLHEFYIKDPQTGKEIFISMPDEEDLEPERVVSELEAKIKDYFTLDNYKAEYVYDFGDNWEHQIELEAILPRQIGVNYPICIDGKRACPPEDVGGVGGYAEFLEIIKNPKHERFEEMREWINGEFDPEYFDPEEVKFDDPKKRLKELF